MITFDTLLSWRMAAWLGGGVAAFVLTWMITRRVQILWQRVLLRAGALALAFTPSWYITGQMLTAMIPVPPPLVPAWYLVVLAVSEGAPGYLLLAGIPIAIATYVLWVGGMSVHHLLGRSHAT